MDNYLMHHQVKGAKWGVQNGPPYPLSSDQMSATEKKKNPGLLSRKTKEEKAEARDKRLKAKKSKADAKVKAAADKEQKTKEQQKSEIMDRFYRSKNPREIYQNGHLFSTDELKEINNRMVQTSTMRDKYIPKTKKEKAIAAAKKFVKDQATDLAKAAITTYVKPKVEEYIKAQFGLGGSKDGKEESKGNDSKSEPTTNDIPKRPQDPPKQEKSKTENETHNAEYVGQKTSNKTEKEPKKEKASKPIDVDFTVREAENSKSSDSGSSWAQNFLSSSNPVLALPAPALPAPGSSDGGNPTNPTDYNAKLSENLKEFTDIANKGKDIVDKLF